MRPRQTDGSSHLHEAVPSAKGGIRVRKLVDVASHMETLAVVFFAFIFGQIVILRAWQCALSSTAPPASL